MSDATGEECRNSSRKNEGMEPKQKQQPVVDVTGGGSKFLCCIEQYCVGTWNVRSMNQGKLGVVTQEMASGNVDISGISELKWTGMGILWNSACRWVYLFFFAFLSPLFPQLPVRPPETTILPFAFIIRY